MKALNDGQTFLPASRLEHSKSLDHILLMNRRHGLSHLSSQNTDRGTGQGVAL